MEQPTQEQSRGWAGWQAEHGEEHAAQAQEAECATDATMRADAAGAPRLARRAAAARTVKACKSYAHTCKAGQRLLCVRHKRGKHENGPQFNARLTCAGASIRRKRASKRDSMIS